MGLKLFLTESGEDTFLSILLNPRLGEWDFGVYSDIVGRHVRWENRGSAMPIQPKFTHF
jgi:hypothetical protein